MIRDSYGADCWTFWSCGLYPRGTPPRKRRWPEAQAWGSSCLVYLRSGELKTPRFRNK